MEVSKASDEEYIYIEISLSLSSPNDPSNSSGSNLLGSPMQQSRGFEFPKGSTPQDRAEKDFPADELFFKGKLLPLHLPPRLQMVRRLQSPKPNRFHHCQDQEIEYQDTDELEEEAYSLPAVLIMPATAPPTNTSTPLIGSCNISPYDSCRVSCELNPEADDCFFEWSNELRNFTHCDEKERFLNGSNHSSSSSAASWSKRLKHIKQSLLCQKLKASRDYLRSLFSKTKGGGGSGGQVARATCNVGPVTGQGLRGSEKLLRRAPSEHSDSQVHSFNCKSLSLSVMKRIHKELSESGSISSHRKSFSAACQQHSMANKPSSNSCSSSMPSSSSSCSSSFSLNLNASVPCDLQLLKTRSSVSSELKNSIQEAIAHCKNSHNLLSSQRTADITSETASC